ncbi:MAG TPA: hypothetical protein VFJ52_00490 [Terriglobia bacterium]|nr:hypothetical protein [Terriglobia bacterium]
MSKQTGGNPSWTKGVSGNPSGRPKVAEEFRAKARKAVDELVLRKWMAEVENDGPEWVRCSELLAAYGYGRPSQSIDVTAEITTQDDAAPLTHEERRALLRLQLAAEKQDDGTFADAQPVK